MTSETKAYIETHISQIENNGIASAYLNCPLSILNDFNNTMHIAGIDYPPEIHIYVVVCCYIANWFKDVRLQSYDFECSSETEDFTFTCENYLYAKYHLQQGLSRLLPKRTVVIDTRSVLMYTGNTILKIRVVVG